MSGSRTRQISRVVLALALAGFMHQPASAARDHYPRHALSINAARISGIDRIVRLKDRYKGGAHLDEIIAECGKDGLDELVFLTADSSAWIVYGRDVRLYTKTVDRVRFAQIRSEPITLAMIDDESEGYDARPPLSPAMALLLSAIVVIGVIVGALSGLAARRSLAAMGSRDPMWDNLFYGLVLGFAGALLLFGLSGRRLEIGTIFPSTPEAHLFQFMHAPLSPE